MGKVKEKKKKAKDYPTIVLLTMFLRIDVFAQVPIWYVKRLEQGGGVMMMMMGINRLV